MLVLLALSNVLAGVFLLFYPDSAFSKQINDSVKDVGTGGLIANLALIFLLAGVIPFGWVMGTRVVPWRGAIRYLGLERPGRGMAWGLLVGVCTLVAVYVVGILYVVIYKASTGHDPQSDSALGDALAGAVNPLLAVGISLSAAFGEEILFRGVLQRWLKWWGQAIVFMVFHAQYGTVTQLVFPLAFGLALGYIYKRTRNLWIGITAHFLFDFTQLMLLWTIKTFFPNLGT